ncbi:small ribosomal subunit protein bS21m isoform X2 [Rhineura floridana]|uniref:small ribosomal subunit protein bS21m isoform X2 n=1 Tax=Rhineura floridana TaxID=261503 RepID=UPI002AC86634|nr:small ribosomal subunit protein bS21m isoform X2 [Rhineura floridana]
MLGSGMAPYEKKKIKAKDLQFLDLGTGMPKMAHHMKFVARTVMVPNGNVDAAYRVLNRILTMDGIIDEAKRRRYYEKPCRRRQREAYETCRRIYNAEMARKINFLSRKNRADPWLGC